VQNSAEISNCINIVAEDFDSGRLDIVVANAGIATHYPALDYTLDQFQDIINVNTNGAFYTAQAAGKSSRGKAMEKCFSLRM
jgi:sorbose reductase